MEELTLTTPALLFPAISLILLAYTNRFLSYAQLVRSLHEQHRQQPSRVTRAQIENLRRRLRLTRTMQALGVASLFLGVSLHEVRISVRALEIHLHDMEE